MGVCEVLCCRSRHDPNRTYHKFPTDTARCNEWLKILGKKKVDLKVKSAVCSRHFRFKDYYSGGKRLLPSAIPVLRLMNSPKKDKPIFKVRKSEPNRKKCVSSHSSQKLRKSVPKITKPKSGKEAKKLPRPLKQLVKSKTVLNESKRKPLLVKTDSCIKNEKSAIENLLNPEPTKAIVTKNLKVKITPLKPASNIVERRSLSVSKKNTPLSRRKLWLLYKNKKSSLKTNERKPTAKLSNKKDSTISKTTKCCDSLISNIKNKLSCKLKENECVADLKNTIVSEEIIVSKSSSDITINEDKKKTKQEQQSSGAICLETSEPQSKNGRSIKKRKRLLSEDDCVDDVIDKSKSKVQKYKNNSSTLNQEKQLQPSICNTGNKNLSGIENKILEMQNKIQMLEKKAILDEKRIETFRKALISQRNSDLQMFMDEKENELLLRMDLLYLDHDLQRICRLCLQLVDRIGDLTPLFWPLKNQALLTQIKQATGVEVEHEDGMPSGICQECLEDIRRMDWLKRRTQKSNSLIRKFLNMKKSSAQNHTENSQLTSDVKLKLCDISSEDEIMEEFKIEDVFSLENLPMTFENITIKQEPEYEEDSKQSNELNATYIIAAEKPKKSRKCGNCHKIFKTPKIMMTHFQYCSKRFQCSECNKCFLNAALFRKHKQTRYSCFCAKYLRHCSDCDIAFRWKWQLVFHVLRHITQMCLFCNKTLYSNEHLQYHFIEFHAHAFD